MGFVLTLIYVVLTIIGPEQFGPAWASYHAFAYLAIITTLVSLPNILTYLRSSIQTFLLLGFIVAIALSEVANGWLGGVIESWLVFLPGAVVFFFTVANVYTIHRLKVLTLAAVAACLVVVVEALCGYYWGYRGDIFILKEYLYSADEVVGQIIRIRGVGFLNDPNDFAQILLVALPLIFIAWRRGRVVANSVIVLVPAALLLWAIYLTHSRGGLIALAVLVLMAFRKRPSTAIASVLILGIMALDFTGGRGISAAEGAGRLEAWAAGLEMFKGAPLFGIGFGSFSDFNDAVTAHNSFVLCLAELGLVGSIMWVALLVTTTIDLISMIGLQEKAGTLRDSHKALHKAAQTGNSEGVSGFLLSDDELFPSNPDTITLCTDKVRKEGEKTVLTLIEEPPSGGDLEAGEQVPLLGMLACSCETLRTPATATATDVETQWRPPEYHMVPKHWVVAMLLALISFMTTSWFLSRAYSTTLWLVLGLATSTIALQRTAPESRDRSRWVFFTLEIEALAIIVTYGIVRFAS